MVSFGLVAFLKDWDNTATDALWRQSMPRSTSPFHEVRIPLLQVPGITGPEYVLPDSAHIFHIKGFGQDFSCSCLVFLAKLHAWPARSLNGRLQLAYSAFRQFCSENKKTTGIDCFSKMVFDMDSNLGSTHHRCRAMGFAALFYLLMGYKTFC